eukprot:1142851-Pelagomonas_calceolata.AAC.1
MGDAWRLRSVCCSGERQCVLQRLIKERTIPGTKLHLSGGCWRERWVSRVGSFSAHATKDRGTARAPSKANDVRLEKRGRVRMALQSNHVGKLALQAPSHHSLIMDQSILKKFKSRSKALHGQLTWGAGRATGPEAHGCFYCVLEWCSHQDRN